VSPEEQAEALNECSILAAMNHPNVIQYASKSSKIQPTLCSHLTRYFDSFVDDDMLHIVMEWAEAGTNQPQLLHSNYYMIN
jgi:serine/threonine protein kinase